MIWNVASNTVASYLVNFCCWKWNRRLSHIEVGLAEMAVSPHSMRVFEFYTPISLHFLSDLKTPSSDGNSYNHGIWWKLFQGTDSRTGQPYLSYLSLMWPLRMLSFRRCQEGDDKNMIDGEWYKEEIAENNDAQSGKSSKIRVEQGWYWFLNLFMYVNLLFLMLYLIHQSLYIIEESGRTAELCYYRRMI